MTPKMFMCANKTCFVIWKCRNKVWGKTQISITRGGRQTAGPLYVCLCPLFLSVVCLHACFFTLSLSSLSLCLSFLSRSILLHSSSNSGHGGRPCSSCCWHLSIWKHSGQYMKQALCSPITPCTMHPPDLIQFKLRPKKSDGCISVKFGAKLCFCIFYFRVVSVARCRHTSAAGVLQVINTHTHPMNHL